MLRFAPAIALLLPLLGITAASAQETGGVALTPQVLDNQNATASVLDHVLGRAQAFQQLRALGLTGGAPTSSNAANPANAAAATQGAGTGSPNTAGGLPGAAFVAGFFQGRAVNTTVLQQEINNTQQSFALTNNNSQSLTVNASNSPVTIGNGNIVRQQVSSSTAINNGSGSASASAVATGAPAKPTHGHRGDHGDRTAQGVQPGQTAIGNAVSLGGTSNAVAGNSAVTAR